MSNSERPSEYLYIEAVRLVLRDVFSSSIEASDVFSFAKSTKERLLVMHEDPFDAALGLTQKYEEFSDDRVSDALEQYWQLKMSPQWRALFDVVEEASA
ncbi:MAG: hypothetical protein AAGG45_08175 [Pseudomonadota bacterium]